MKRALLLQGGGAKGAYEAGAIKALTKKGIYFDGVGGTSIGAINAAFYVVHNLEGMYKLWLNTKSDDLFGINGDLLDDFYEKNYSKENIKKAANTVRKIIKSSGVDTANIKKILSNNIDEKRFRKSKIDYAINTYNLTDKKPLEVYKKDIPEGKLIEYILSSAYLPIFKSEKIIDDKYYIDGGVYMNCPVKMFIDQGYDEIYVIKVWRFKLKFDNPNNIKVNVITPRERLGSSLRFTASASQYRMNLGYYDTLRFLYNLDGNKYYLKYYDEDYYDLLFTKEDYKKIFRKYNKGVRPINKKRFIIKMIEKSCKELNIERFKIYNVPMLITKLKLKSVSNKKLKCYDFLYKIKIEFI